MGVSNIGRSVSCIVLLTVVLSVKRSVGISNDCPIDALEERLTRIEQKLELLVGDIPPCTGTKQPPVTDNCEVSLASYGYDDEEKFGYVRTSGGSSEEIFLPDDPQRNRGVTLFELDLESCTTGNRQHFDTWALDSDRTRLLEALESAETGTILVGVTADSAENGDLLKDKVGAWFASYNMDLTGFNERDKFAFVLQKGSPDKTVFKRKARDQGGLKLTVKVSGTTVGSVTFNEV